MMSDCEAQTSAQHSYLEKAFKEGNDNSLYLVPAKKRTKSFDENDSDIEDDHKDKKVKNELTVHEKEQRFLLALKMEPHCDTLNLQDALLRCDWEVLKGLKYYKENFSVQPKILNGTPKPKKNRKDIVDYDSEDNQRPEELVYDSDDSDNESNSRIISQRNSVLDFLNKASINELLAVKSCSEKKAALITDLRPFSNWDDLKTKLENAKALSTDLLNYCQDLINKQRNLANIMNKCKKSVQKLETAVAAGCGIVKQPSILNESFKLAEYQMLGLNWLAVMHKEKMNGILADEMGLGKTIQVIAFLAYLKQNNLSKGANLIIVPSSTMDNWETEIRKWCPKIQIEKYYGSQEERRQMRKRFAKEGFKGIDVLLTTYTVATSTPEERKMFSVVRLHYVIFDEAHMLKNMTTQRYAQLIKINAEMRLLLTGTPLQNNLLELMSLLCFVMPSYFQKNKEDIKCLFPKKTKKTEDSTAFEGEQIERAKNLMKPFVLRRLKKDVLKYLPKKTEHIVKIAMTEKQKEYYKGLVEYYSNNGVVKGTTELAGATIMMDMRKLANHPLLMRNYYTDDVLKEMATKLAKCATYKGDNSNHIFEDLAYLSDFQIWQIFQKNSIRGYDLPEELILDSGKFKELDKMLPNLKKQGHRLLIFSQFTMMMDIIEPYLLIRKHCYLRLDGSTLVTERKELIDNFNNNPDIFIFLLSTKAGGMGINLTAADIVIIHDIDFNPYNDKQAEDRCHRMGQTKPVNIYRFISEGTIEEGMLVVSEEKLKLEKEISGDTTEFEEHKCMVRLLAMALGMEQQRAEVLLSPNSKVKNSK